jgi:hypothetical protein
LLSRLMVPMAAVAVVALAMTPGAALAQELPPCIPSPSIPPGVGNQCVSPTAPGEVRAPDYVSLTARTCSVWRGRSMHPSVEIYRYQTDQPLVTIYTTRQSNAGPLVALAPPYPNKTVDACTGALS